MSHSIMAIDQGTTSSRAIIFSREGAPLGHHQMDLKQYYPHDGWVEQDPKEIWQNTLTCCRMALKNSGLSADLIKAVGITNQRETVLIWDLVTGEAVYPAIVWQDRRTASLCEQLAEQPWVKRLPQKTGLLLDPYFSATKILWILQQVPGVRERAAKGELAFGTVDTFLLWRLTHGKHHLTDATNASRTLLYNIHTQQWDDEILTAFNVPRSLLPKVTDNSYFFGEMAEEFLGKKIPITGMAGDQQAALIGQACFQPGMMKSTFGTGAFMLLNTGDQVVLSQHRLLSTIAYRVNGKVAYGLEGSIFSAGVTVKWFRDDLKFIKTAAETETLARSVADTGGVYIVPGFTGLGAPYWDPLARGAILGLTRNSQIAHIVRAGLEAVVYQTRDLLEAMRQDSGTALEIVRADGGMAANDWLLQFLADILAITVQRPTYVETSALGAAFLAGLQVGIYQSLDEIATLWQANISFTATMQPAERKGLYAGWKKALGKVIAKA